MARNKTITDGVLIALALLGLVTGAHAEASRTLSFPADGWMGNLYLVPESGLAWDAKGVRPEGQLEYLGAARGEVRVPEGRDARLWVRLDLTPREAARLQRLNPQAHQMLIADRVREYPDDLSGLSQLDPNGLFWLSVSSPTFERTGVPAEAFEPIGRLTGLKMLTLQSTGITDAGLELLRPLRSLKGLELTQFPISVRALAILKDLPELEYLSLCTYVTDAGLKQVAEVPGLRWLNIVGGKMWGPGLAELAQLPHLERLCFWGARGGGTLTDRHLKHLEGVTQLKSLTLQGADALTDASLASISRIANLEELYFIRCTPHFTPAGVAHLQSLKHLKKVDFAQTWVGPQGERYGDEIARQLAAIPQLESVEQIGYLSAEGMKAVATMHNLKCLYVSLKDSNQGYSGPTGLSFLAGLGSLQELSISSGDRLSDADLASLETLSRLKELNIFSRAGVSERGLASIGKLKQLERLHLETLTRDGLNHLNGLSNLEYLDVTGAWQNGTFIVTPGETTLDLSGLKNIKELCLSQLWLKDGDLTFLKELPALENLMIQQTTPLTSSFFRELRGLPELNHLWVWGLTDCTAEDLAQLNDLPKLRFLILQGEITDAALASLKGPACLESVHLDTDHPIRQETVDTLAASHPVLEHVHINTFTPAVTQPAPPRRPTGVRQPRANRPRGRR